MLFPRRLGLRFFSTWQPRDWAALGVLFLGLITLLSQDLEPKRFSDNYFIMAKTPWWDLGLYKADRPFGIYFLYKLAGYDPLWVVRLQTAYSVLSWTFLGLVLAASFKRETAAIMATIFVALAALGWNIAGWNQVLLTESATASTFALFYAVLLLVWRQPSRIRLVGLLAVSAYLGVMRDQLPFFIVTVAGFCWVFAFWQRRDRQQFFRHASVFLVFSIVLLGFTSWTAQLGKRHVFSLYNVLFQRILPNPPLAQWFEAEGMPVDLLLNGPHDWEGEWASSHGRELYTNRYYMPFHHWSIGEGKSDFARFLLLHPRYVWQLAWRHRQDIFSANLEDYTGAPPKNPLFFIARWLWSPWSRWFLIPLGLAYAFLLARRQVSPLPLILAICGLINGVLAFHADAMEVQRHCLFTGWALTCAAWHALFLVIAKLSQMRQRPPN